jgi:hypothetical protein
MPDKCQTNARQPPVNRRGVEERNQRRRNEAESSCNVPELPKKPARLYSSDPFSALHTKPAGTVTGAWTLPWRAVGHLVKRWKILYAETRYHNDGGAVRRNAG